ncbi:unnamed protein product [Rotaria sp. Silwood1]|nr:unnamed protein product [Rotaria sp. Silwood1]
MTTSEFYNNLIISSAFPFKIDKKPNISKTLRHCFLDDLALLLNGSNSCTSVYPLEYSQYCLTLNEHDMNKIYSLLKSIIFEYNKSKCIKRITDDLFADAISNLENLLNANVDDLCQKITYNKSKKSSADYYYLKEKSRHAIKNNKNNVELKIILEFQVTGELLYDSEIFCSMLSKVYSIDNDAERILYYLDKVSAHQRSLNLILKTLHKRKSEYACRLGNDETKKEFQDRFIENKFVEYDLSLKLSTCLHSEIRMIDYLIEQNIKEVHDNDVEIGISKLPCYLCSLYIEKLNGDFNRTFYIGSLRTNEKIYPNWMFRNNEKDKIIYDINNQLCKFIKK